MIQSGQWEIDSIKHLLDVLVNGSEDKKDLKVISHFADAKLETGIFKTNENGCKWSDFDLIEQHLSLFIPYLDLIEGNRKNVRLLSQKKVEDFVDKQLSADCHPKRPPVPYYPASASHIIRPAINHYSTVLLT